MKIFAIAALAALIAVPALAETVTTTETTASITTTTPAYITSSDTDKNGTVSWDEAKVSTDTVYGTEAAFKAADTDADGFLSTAEVEAGSMAATSPAAH